MNIKKYFQKNDKALCDSIILHEYKVTKNINTWKEMSKGKNSPRKCKQINLCMFLCKNL